MLNEVNKTGWRNCNLVDVSMYSLEPFLNNIISNNLFVISYKSRTLLAFFSKFFTAIFTLFESPYLPLKIKYNLIKSKLYADI